MDKATCPLCGQSKINSIETNCPVCGYNATIGKISDKELFKAYYRKINTRNHPWSKSVEFLSNSFDLLRCSQSYLVKTLNISKAKVSDDLALAKDLKENPELKDYQSKTKAKQHVRTPFVQVFQTEEDLQRYIYQNWDDTPFAKEWSLTPSTSYMGKFPAGDSWEMDFLAHHKTLNKWLVVEIKQDKTSDETVGQILRYMGWVKQNKANETDEVEGVIICGNADDEMLSSLICVPFIRIQIYRKKDGEIKFMSYDESKSYDAKAFLDSLPPNEMKLMLKKLKKIQNSSR